jgi:uridine phosphorylase
MEKTFPILEHEYLSEAQIEPSRVIKPKDVPEVCVISFFMDVILKVVGNHQAKVIVDNRWEDGPHPIYELQYSGQRIAFFHPGVGSPIASGLLEEAIAYGCKKFIVVGGAGVLEKGLEVGKLILVTAAVRDEGVSYHYLPPAREVSSHPAGCQALASVLEEKGIPYVKAKTWTTDAPYRETSSTIVQRRSEGCLTVEMEAAALMAVASFRKVILGQLLYAGDDLSGSEWDNRGWQSRQEIRENMFWLAVEAGLRV